MYRWTSVLRSDKAVIEIEVANHIDLSRLWRQILLEKSVNSQKLDN